MGGAFTTNIPKTPPHTGPTWIRFDTHAVDLYSQLLIL